VVIETYCLVLSRTLKTLLFADPDVLAILFSKRLVRLVFAVMCSIASYWLVGRVSSRTSAALGIGENPYDTRSKEAAAFSNVWTSGSSIPAFRGMPPQPAKSNAITTLRALPVRFLIS